MYDHNQEDQVQFPEFLYPSIYIEPNAIAEQERKETKNILDFSFVLPKIKDFNSINKEK
jgi:hypothetical protein